MLNACIALFSTAKGFFFFKLDNVLHIDLNKFVMNKY